MNHTLKEMIITEKQEKEIAKVTKVTDKMLALLGGPFVRGLDESTLIC